MTYDERREIELYLNIIRQNAKRLERNVEMLQKALDKIPCHVKEEPSEG